MTISSHVERLNDWFTRYTDGFSSENEPLMSNFELKREHCRKVRDETLDIAASIGLNDNDLCIAHIAALFHDIGRFEQLRRYRTYFDHESENHAELGISVLKQHKVLDKLDTDTQELIYRAIAFHNRPSMPPDQTPRTVMFTAIIRDADKLDILRIATDYYVSPNSSARDAVELGLPLAPDISQEVFESAMNGTIIKNESIKSYNDFKVMQMGWVFDMNFRRSFELVKQRRYLEKIRDALPHSEQTQKLYTRALQFLEDKLHG